MDAIKIIDLDKKRFDALASQSRSPAASYISEELAWYSNKDESVIGVVLLDTIDNDFTAIVLGQDEVGKYRAFDLESSMLTQDAATEWLHRAMKWHTGTGKKVFPQGDEGESLDLFKPLVPIEKQHPYFVSLRKDPGFLPAREIINKMMPHFVDVDGNFVEQFQTQGFDARLWELFVNTFLFEEGFFIDRNYNSPDFLITKFGVSLAVEAVIVGRKENNQPRYFREFKRPIDPKDALDELENNIPIKFGSPLFSKLNKRYWELEHVKNKPIIFAIADFHDDQSMMWSSTGLLYYLYGLKQKCRYDQNNQLIIESEKIEVHKSGSKEIPSGYFWQPETENISAILFSASGTISKFNRLGKQAGFGHPEIVSIRVGMCHDHDPNASMPKMFRYKVDTNCQETWGEGVSMFHNPKAINPVPEDLFPNIAHHYFIDGEIVSHLPEFHPYASYTMHFKPKMP